MCGGHAHGGAQHTDVHTQKWWSPRSSTVYVFGVNGLKWVNVNGRCTPSAQNNRNTCQSCFYSQTMSFIVTGVWQIQGLAYIHLDLSQEDTRHSFYFAHTLCGLQQRRAVKPHPLKWEGRWCVLSVIQAGFPCGDKEEGMVGRREQKKGQSKELETQEGGSKSQ